MQDGQDQEVYGQRDWYVYHMSSSSNSSQYSSSGSPTEPSSALPHRTPSRLRRRPPREGYHPLGQDNSKAVTAAGGIAQEENHETLPTTFRRNTSNGKLKKPKREPGAPGNSLRERKLSSSGNGDGLSPGELQRSPSRKLKKQKS